MTSQNRPDSVDFAYLESYLGGSLEVVLEVLALFRGQAEGWAAALQAPGEDWRALAHTVKGAARGVGANALGEACERAEFGDVADLAAVRDELAAAVAAIAAYQAQKVGA